MELKKSKK